MKLGRPLQNLKALQSKKNEMENLGGGVSKGSDQNKHAFDSLANRGKT